MVLPDEPDAALERTGQVVRDFALDMMQDPLDKIILLRDILRTIRQFEYRRGTVVLE